MKVELGETYNPGALVRCYFCSNQKLCPIDLKSINVELVGSWVKIGYKIWCGMCDPRDGQHYRGAK